MVTIYNKVTGPDPIDGQWFLSFTFVTRAMAICHP